jgi:ubiquinone/menaquinone biosynthesis C-methylase UbiE
MTDQNRIETFYDQYSEREITRSSRHRMEFEITFRTIQEKLPTAPVMVLDIGGGPGYYSMKLASLGHNVTLLDLSTRNLENAQRMAAEQCALIRNYVHGTALDLSVFASHEFDVVLLMGPLYHLLTAPERIQAVQEARRVLKPGGLIFAAFISRFAPFRDAAHRGSSWVEDHPDWTDRVLNEGINCQEWGGFTDAYFEWPEAIAPFMEENGFLTDQITGCEGVVASNEDFLNSLQEPGWRAWLDLNYRLSKSPAILGASDHLLYCGRSNP